MADPLTCNLLVQLASSVLVEGSEREGEKVSSRPHPSPSSLHLSPWSFVPQLPLWLSLPIGHPNRFLCFRFPLLLGNNSQKEDREREGKRSWHSTGTPSPAMAVAITSAVVDFPTWRGRETDATTIKATTQFAEC